MKIVDAPFSFNRSIRIGSRRDRITGDSGALTGRELLRRSRVVRFLAKGLPDKRDGRRIRHSQRRLARTLLLLAGQGRREHSDATTLRDDPALRLATGDRAGTAPLGKAGRLPSQPTLSRRVAAWSAKDGVEVLREGLQRLAGWRLKAMGGRRRPKTLVIDIDSLPVEVHGEQPGSAWNGYYHRRVYHPIVAAAGETGDILDLRLREGQVHTADGGLEFVLEVLERAERHLCGKAAVRFDAGYPGEPLMAALEERGTHYVARVRNNAVLKRLALPAMDAVGLGCVEQRGARWRAPHLGLRVVLPGRVVVPFPQGRAGRRRAAGRTHPALLPAADFDALRGDVRRGPPGAVPQTRQGGGPPGRADERRGPGPVVHVAPQEPLPGQGDQEAREGGRRLRVQPGPPAARRLRLPDHARPARRAGARDRHWLEPAAPCRTRAPHPGALHRLGPPDHDNHRRRVGALAHARPRTRHPARTLRIARPPPGAEPFPGPGGRSSGRKSAAQILEKVDRARKALAAASA